MLTASFLRRAPTSVVDEDPAHGLRGHPEEVRTTLEAHRGMSGEAEKRLVHQGGRAEGVVRALVAKLTRGELAQFRVYQWHQPVQALGVPTGHPAENPTCPLTT